MEDMANHKNIFCTFVYIYLKKKHLQVESPVLHAVFLYL